jgi:DNA-binding MurR/RpiR family transcriptional regulator
MVSERQIPPVDFETLRALVLDRRDSLPKRLAQVARFALDQPDEIALGTVAEIAGHAGVQPSTLVRFAQALGFSGFSDLQQVFRLRLRDRWPDYKERLAQLKEGADGRTGPAGLLDGFVETAVTSLMRLRESVRAPELERAVAVMAAAETIYLLGQRRAFPIASYLAYAFGKLGIRAVLLDNVGALLAEQAAFAGPRDAMLTISFTPYTPSTVEVARAAAQRGTPIVAITDSAFSPLAPIATVWLEVAEADRGAFRSLAATLSLAMTLAVTVGERREAT